MCSQKPALVVAPCFHLQQCLIQQGTEATMRHFLNAKLNGKLKGQPTLTSTLCVQFPKNTAEACSVQSCMSVSCWISKGSEGATVATEAGMQNMV